MRARRWAARLALGLWLAGRVAVWAGGGPAGVVVVYDPNDIRSLTMANAYQQARGIPERNLFPYAFPEGFTRHTAWDLVYALRGLLAERGLEDQLQALALAAYTPLDSAQTTGSALSLHSFLYLSPAYSHASIPTYVMANNPAYPSSGPTAEAFQAPAPAGTQALNAYTEYGGKRVWPVSALGYPGRAGNSLGDILRYIGEARAADGTRPEGTIYWPLNKNIRSTTRQSQVGPVTAVWAARGIRYAVHGTEDLNGSETTGANWVFNRPDVIGGVVGAANLNPRAGNRYLPGAWVDHLTSFGGRLDDYDGFYSYQSDAADWLRAGVHGSAGTMEEPGAVASKFPHPHIHTHFRSGASLSEGFWQSIQLPAQILCLGDPLLQPHARFPVVTILTPAAEAEVSGVIHLQAQAVPAAGQTLAPEWDLFLDGRRVAGAADWVTPVADGFLLDTTAWSDGWHELRVTAYNADSVRTQGEAVRSLRVNNHGQALTLTGPETVHPEMRA
ncbi:MAG: hypothetical protein K9N49_07430, partial [Candidatus Marinimicrobia bacterium]|nr:hypothetical protein [Candidatus Neomarinimicrobiota bacterium]